MSTYNIKSKEIKKLFNHPDTLFFVALSMLNLDKKNVLPELLYTLDKQAIVRLSAVYGGDTIYIPTTTELRDYLTSSICTYYKAVQRRRWSSIKKVMSLSDDQVERYKANYLNWLKNAPKEEIKTLKSFKEYGVKDV